MTYSELRKRRICVLITESDLYYSEATPETKLKDISYISDIAFNNKEVVLRGITKDFHMDGIKVFLLHPEFDKLAEAEENPMYHLHEAKKRHPFLFTDTNPILWRKFK